MRHTVALALCLLTGGAVAPQAQGPRRPGRDAAAARRDARTDLRLADRLSRAGDTERERVIITVKPGTKPGLLRALLAQGAQVSHDLTLIEAFAGDVPAGLLRALQHHPDVVALSTDAEMRPMGVTSSVSGAAENTPYTLRRTLGLDSSIAVDNTSTAKGNTASLSWAHTVATGSNRLLLVRTSHRDGNKSVTG